MPKYITKSRVNYLQKGFIQLSDKLNKDIDELLINNVLIIELKCTPWL